MALVTAAAETFASALATFQASLPHVTKDNTAKITGDKGSYSYTYADLSDIAKAVLPALAKVGLSFTSRSTFAEGRFILEACLLHTDGHREVSSYPLPDPTRATPQQIGSAMTYGRRYALCCLTGVAPAGDDDDAQVASNWPAAAKVPSTDPVWQADWMARLEKAFTQAEFDNLKTEARSQMLAGDCTPGDAEDLKTQWDTAVARWQRLNAEAAGEPRGELTPSEAAGEPSPDVQEALV